MTKPKVMICACPDYDMERIRGIVKSGLEKMGLRPSGRVLVKPNVVAAGSHFPHAFTRPEFTEGVLRALRDCSEGMTELAVGERCGITVPTRFAYKEAKYPQMVKRVGDVKLYHFEEVPQVEIPLYHQGRMRDSIFTPEPVAAADFFVNCPKFKGHPWTTVTFSMKNYIGIQDDRHRLIDHDHKLNRKVADLQYITQPKFIAIDAITAGESRMLTPIPFDLGLVIMGNNQVAFDSVCSQIIGLDPMEIEHIRLGYERGFGPIDIAQIELLGDVSLDQAKERAQGFRTGLVPVEEYFEGSNIRAYGGKPPGEDEDYCWGGCPGALEEAVEIMRLFDTRTDERMPPVHIVFGHHEGEIPAKEGEKVIFVGDCAEFKGKVDGEEVEVQSVYIDRSQKNPLEARHDDIFGKMISVSTNLWSKKKQQVIRIKGCPVSVAEQVLLLVHLGKLKNPYFDTSQAVGFTSCYLSWRTRTMIKRLMGESYNQVGPTHRGASRPDQNLPPAGIEAPLEMSSGPTVAKD